jgi:hypothetical protein
MEPTDELTGLMRERRRHETAFSRAKAEFLVSRDTDLLSLEH